MTQNANRYQNSTNHDIYLQNIYTTYASKEKQKEIKQLFFI